MGHRDLLDWRVSCKSPELEFCNLYEISVVFSTLPFRSGQMGYPFRPCKYGFGMEVHTLWVERANREMKKDKV